MLLTEVIIYLVAAFKRVGINANAQVTLVFGAQHRQQVVRRDAVERVAEFEVAAVFCGFRGALSALGDLGAYASETEDAAQVLPDCRGLAQPFGYDVSRAGKGFLHILDLVAYELAGITFWP